MFHLNVSSLLLSSGFVNTPFLCSLKKKALASSFFFFSFPPLSLCLSVARSALLCFNTVFFFFFLALLVLCFDRSLLPRGGFTGDVVILIVEEQ